VELLLAALAAAVFCAALVWYQVTHYKREKTLGQLASELGLKLHARAPEDLPGRFSTCSALAQGEEREASNVMTGRLGGREVLAFDFRYVTGSDRNRHEHRLSAAAVAGSAIFPLLLIRPERLRDRLLDPVLAAAGQGEIEFESAEFNRAFYVWSPDHKFACDFVDPRMMEYLLAERGWCFETCGSDLVVYTGRLWSAEEFKRALAALTGLAERIPRHLVHEVRQSTGEGT
jgi:hypothetical protein